MSVECRVRNEKLKTQNMSNVIGNKIIRYDEVDSTNELAVKLANEGASHGTVIIAQSQSSGRGRFNRQWISPKGGLWFSVILKPQIAPKDASKIVFLTSIAVAKAVETVTGKAPEIKWPNDLLFSNKKFCGILLEMRSDIDRISHIVTGIGLNVNIPADVLNNINNATSLEIEFNRKFDINGLLDKLLLEINRFYDIFIEKGFEPILEEWKRYFSGTGKIVRFQENNTIIEGEIFDINSEGILIVKTGGWTLKHIIGGEIEYVNSRL